LPGRIVSIDAPTRLTPDLAGAREVLADGPGLVPRTIVPPLRRCGERVLHEVPTSTSALVLELTIAPDGTGSEALRTPPTSATLADGTTRAAMRIRVVLDDVLAAPVRISIPTRLGHAP
jgi:hypothetical protein